MVHLNLDFPESQRKTEMGYVFVNATGFDQPSKLSFTKLDEDHSVGSDGLIYQIMSPFSMEQWEEYEDLRCLDLVYAGDEQFYNYAEDGGGDFNEDTEEYVLYERCLQMAEDFLEQNK